MDDTDRLTALLNLGVTLEVDGVHAMVRAAEAEIARRGLRDAYSRALCYVVGIPIAEHESYYDPSVDVEHDLFLLITAPPEARVRAMLRALGEG